jgi:hypothetical protein
MCECAHIKEKIMRIDWRGCGREENVSGKGAFRCRGTSDIEIRVSVGGLSRIPCLTNS